MGMLFYFKKKELACGQSSPRTSSARSRAERVVGTRAARKILSSRLEGVPRTRARLAHVRGSRRHASADKMADFNRESETSLLGGEDFKK